MLVGTAYAYPNAIATVKEYGPNHETTEVVSAEVPDELDIWIDRLAFMESSGKEDIIILDVNGRYSFGCLQFQERTWLSFQWLQDELGEEISMDTIMDCPLQKRLVKRILVANPGLWTHWYTSVAIRGLGRPPVVIHNQELDP